MNNIIYRKRRNFRVNYLNEKDFTLNSYENYPIILITSDVQIATFR